MVLPAYNAARTLRQTYAEIPHEIVDDVILTDDHSRDDTATTRGSRALSNCNSFSNRNCDSAGAPSKLNMLNSNRFTGGGGS